MKYYFITWWTFLSECWCNGPLNYVLFPYQKKIFFLEPLQNSPCLQSFHRWDIPAPSSLDWMCTAHSSQPQELEDIIIISIITYTMQLKCICFPGVETSTPSGQYFRRFSIFRVTPLTLCTKHAVNNFPYFTLLHELCICAGNVCTQVEYRTNCIAERRSVALILLWHNNETHGTLQT